MELANVFNKENYLYNKKQYPYGPDAYDGKWSPLFSETDRLNALDTNWKDYVLKSGYITKHNLTISGGTSRRQHLSRLCRCGRFGLVRRHCPDLL